MAKRKKILGLPIGPEQKPEESKVGGWMILVALVGGGVLAVRGIVRKLVPLVRTANQTVGKVGEAAETVSGVGHKITDE